MAPFFLYICKKIIMKIYHFNLILIVALALFVVHTKFVKPVESPVSGDQIEMWENSLGETGDMMDSLLICFKSLDSLSDKRYSLLQGRYVQLRSKVDSLLVWQDQMNKFSWDVKRFVDSQHDYNRNDNVTIYHLTFE